MFELPRVKIDHYFGWKTLACALHLRLSLTYQINLIFFKKKKMM